MAYFDHASKLQTMKTILVPTDFSELSRHAIDFAVHLAKPHHAKVNIVHFEDRPVEDLSLHLTGAQNDVDAVSSESLFNVQLFRANKVKLTEWVQKYNSDEVRVTGQQLGGGFLKGIQHYLKHVKADLIVIGTTGEQSLLEFFSGNHTEQLIEQVQVPVISIHDKVDTNIQDVVLGINMMEEVYPLETLQYVGDIMKGLKAKLHIVNIVPYEIPEHLLHSLNELAREAKLENYIVDVITEEKSNETLLAFAEEQDAGLIISISEAKGGINRFLRYSFSTHLTKVSSIPVLTINKAYFQ